MMFQKIVFTRTFDLDDQQSITTSDLYSHKFQQTNTCLKSKIETICEICSKLTAKISG